MRVLFHNRDPKKWVGGDAIQLQRTMEALQRLGVDAVFSDKGHEPINDFDLVHIFHINFFWTKEMYEQCLLKKKPYIISAIFFPEIYDIPKHEMFKFAVNAQKIICLSEAEKREMVEFLNIYPDKIVVIPNGVDKSVFKPNPHKKRKKFVMSVGRLAEPLKGSAHGLLACKKAGYEYVYVGQSIQNDEAETLKKHLTHHEYLPPEELAKLYQTAGVYLCPSLSERQSLAVLEAAACGCPIVDSIHNRGNTLLPSSIVTDPSKPDEVAKAIRQQMGDTNTDFVPSWDDVAKQILDEYKATTRA